MRKKQTIRDILYLSKFVAYFYFIFNAKKSTKIQLAENTLYDILSPVSIFFSLQVMLCLLHLQRWGVLREILQEDGQKNITFPLTKFFLPGSIFFSLSIYCILSIFIDFFLAVFRIRTCIRIWIGICRIRMFWGLPDPPLDLLVTSTDTDPDKDLAPDSSLFS